MSEFETLEIVDDSEEYSSSSDEEQNCYFCDAELDYEENEFYDWEAGRFYCERCWNHIKE